MDFDDHTSDVVQMATHHVRGVETAGLGETVRDVERRVGKGAVVEEGGNVVRQSVNSFSRGVDDVEVACGGGGGG
jgi:hypothetical protein